MQYPGKNVLGKTEKIVVKQLVFKENSLFLSKIAGFRVKQPCSQ